MENSDSKNVNRLFVAGFIIILVSLLILIFSGLNRNANSDFFNDNGAFFVVFIASIVYSVLILVNNQPFLKFKKIDKRLYILSLTIFSISAFTLNHSITIFAQFSTWVNYYLIIFYLSFVGLCFIEKLPGFLRTLIFFFLGAGLVLVLYFAAYLAPLYHIAILGSFLLGLSVHLLAPLITLISVIVIFARLNTSKFDKISFYSGILIPLIITSVFLIQWNSFKKEIHKASSSVITRPDNTLPEWVLLCQNIPTDNFTKKIIEGDLVYDTFDDLWRGFSNNAFDEVKRHNPLVNVGLALFGDINLDTDTRIKILKSQHSARHLAQRKLWMGRDIGTIEVLSNIKVYPDYRIAYTEKIITVKNFSNWENNQQEAAFTFYLPEGSVATSLSLWIDGKEEKSRLTTKSKADSAYVSIVGIERRDPALMHWQEGNTLTVTVFPCTPKKNRKFKIGITTPLEKIDENLVLKNIYFEGPVSKDIMETTVISFESEETVQSVNLPRGFKSDLDQKYVYTGDYRAYWEAGCKATTLSDKAFVFNNKSYRILELKKQKMKFEPKSIYLDLNKSWTKNEFDAIFEWVSDKKVYAHHDKLIEVNVNNKDEIFEIMSSKNFSLFAFNEIKNIEDSFVISKSTELSPNLSDLEKTEFAEELIKAINSSQKRINLFQIGNVMSPYLKTLKELQIFNFQSGTVKDLENIFNKGHFVKSNEDLNQVDLDIAQISIHRDTILHKSEAPDHLLRLFAYNVIMKDLGRNYFNKNSDYIDDLVVVANEAYVVSPVSSLIVLETIKDYERFDIGENQNSLKNASVKSSGAVPEPSEWLLIGLLILIMSIMFFKRNHIANLRWK